MHELAIAQSLAETVAARAAACGASRVKTVRLRIGDASGVVPDSLTFCFEMLASLDPLLEGARLAIELVPHRAWCPGCNAAFAIEGFVARCPICGEWSDRIISGAELELLDMDIETETESETKREAG